MDPRGPQVGPKWLPSPPFGVAKMLQIPMDFNGFLVWQQVKVAPRNKTNKKSNKRLLSALGRSVPRRKSPKRPKDSSQDGPKRAPGWLQEGPKMAPRWLPKAEA